MSIKNQAISQQRRDLRTRLFPDVDPASLWDRKTKAGYTTLPRTMPLILVAMDYLSSGKPLSSTYLELWCRAYDEMLVDLSDPQAFAFAAGFSGQRWKQTWIQRVKILSDLGFIKTAAGVYGPISHALILNPHLVIKKLESQVPPTLFNAIVTRASAVGAKDL